MICENYSSVAQRVQSRLGKQTENIVIAQYSNDFSVAALERLPCFSADDVYYVWHEFDYHRISGGYEPFLDGICRGFRAFGDGDFSAFLEECQVYFPHREVLSSYYQEGFCRRREMVLLDEVPYEQNRMTKAIAGMLRALAGKRPMLLVLNRFQLASRSAMEVVAELLRHPSMNIGMVLGVNEKPGQDESVLKCWEEILERLSGAGHVYPIGNSGQKREYGPEGRSWRNFQCLYRTVNNTAELLDYDQAAQFFQDMAHGVRFEGEILSDGQKLQLYPLYARVAILRGDFATALEVIHLLARLRIPGREHHVAFAREYYLAMCRMYQGKLGRSYDHAQKAERAAEQAGEEQLKLAARLLIVQTQMSGWYNLFFCLKDIEIPQPFLDTLQEMGFYNFLAHVYVYAFDNDPQTVAGSCCQGAELERFNRGIRLAERIGNEHLIYNAQQKNIMIADTYGYYQVAVFYLLKAFDSVTEKRSLECGRIYSALGYNFSALGRHRVAEGYYQKAIGLFLELKLPEEIAEVFYNMSLGSIMEKDYALADHRLLFCIKAVDKLRLNSLRVCNLAKIYGLLALESILQKDRFGCRRYLDDCAQLLNNSDGDGCKIEINHDYARLDDERFLYWFSSALLCWEDGDLDQAQEDFQRAEIYLEQARSNQFYAYRIFYEKRIALLEERQCPQEVHRDRLRLEQYERSREQIWDSIAGQLQGRLGVPEWSSVDETQIEALLKQEGMARELRSSRRRMDFLYSWQKLIDVGDLDTPKMISNAIYSFLNQFGNDCALYLRYGETGPRVLYNDTGVEITPQLLGVLDQAMVDYPQGFAVSKISGNFQRHRDLIACFGADKVCSFAAVPFFKEGQLESVMLTYVLMKENWHASMESYMINKADLAIYQLLFRELGYSLNRIEAYEKICEMNQKLSQAATTDTLTGLLNRTGLYRELDSLMERLRKTHGCLALMFIDLDNFKYYNDTFGHHAGDLILTSMARIFRQAVGTRGIVSRYGGDEFLILLEENRKEALEEIAREIYSQIRQEKGFDEEISRVLGHPAHIDDGHRITCSIGIAVDGSIREEKDVQELIKKADDILYAIKKSKKGTYAFFNRGSVPH